MTPYGHDPRAADRHATPPDPAEPRLDALLRAAAQRPYREHHRRVGRIAVTLRLAPRWRGLIPDGLVPLDDLRLLCLGYRWCAGSGNLRARVPLAVLAPHLDLPGSGRVAFRCARVFDLAARRGPAALDPAADPETARTAVLMDQAAGDAADDDLADAVATPELYFAFHPGRPPVLEATRTPAQWAGGGAPIGLLRGWPAGAFTRPPGRRFSHHPADGSPDPWEAGLAHPDAPRYGSWARSGGLAVPDCQAPEAVYADTRPFAGRLVRNPAWGVLRGHRLVPPGSYAGWRDALFAPGDGGAAGGPEDAGSPAWGLRAAVERYADDPARRAALWADLAAAAEAVGLAVADPDDLAAMVMSPWDPYLVPGRPAVQVVRLAGPPGPETLAFGNDVFDLDLFSTGGARGGRYEPLAPGDVEEAFRQQAARSVRLRRWEAADDPTGG